ncbi:hypothetical protein FRC17_001732 [Serendipita sp. 399]|nr:hypothetical protein FRC17_001732 [Serendipita sp. 399]
MEFWPYDQRPVKAKHGKHQKFATASRKDATGTENQTEHSALGPVLTYGSLTAVLLRESPMGYGTGGQLEWDFISSSKGKRLYKTGSSTHLFAGTGGDFEDIPRLSALRKAEEASRFLRHRFTDIDIPFEIIKQAIEEDENDSKEVEDNLQGGNLLALVHSRTTKDKDNYTAVLFPVGELKNQLNVSFLSLSRTKKVVYDPGTAPATTFETPIEQIISSTVPYRSEGYSEDNPTFAVRTMSLVVVYSITFGRALLSTMIHPLAVLKISDIGDVVDLVISPFDNRKLALISHTGAVSILQVKEPEPEWMGLNIPEGVHDLHWRICWSSDDHNIVRSHSKALEIVDINDGAITRGLKFADDEPCLSVEGTISQGNSELHRVTVTTTQRVIWIDDRYLDKNGNVLPRDRNGLVNVYSVSTYLDAVRSSSVPQILESQARNHRRLGYAFYQHPGFETHGFSFLEFSPKMGLFATQFTIGRESVNPSEESTSPGSIALAREIQTTNFPEHREFDTATDSSIRQSVEVNMESVYRGEEVLNCVGIRLFNEEIVDSVIAQKEKTVKMEAVYDILEQMPRFWQENDIPVETIITARDIALNVGPQPEAPSQSNFLANVPLYSHNGYLALRSGHFPKPEVLAAGSGWSFDLSTTVKALQGRSDAPLERTNTPKEQELFHKEAKKQQDMDLKLHDHIYSSQKLTNPMFPRDNRTDMSLEDATEELSLEDSRKRPPMIRMAFLKPRSTAEQTTGPKKLGKDSIGMLREASLGTRLLLSEWELGEDPNYYEYASPYSDTVEENLTSKPPVSQKEKPAGIETSPPLRAPPKIGMSQPLPAPVSSQMVKPSNALTTLFQTINATSSQVPRSPTLELSQSQDLTIATQVLPGKHGGRPKPPVKKQKKRVGGF